MTTRSLARPTLFVFLSNAGFLTATTVTDRLLVARHCGQDDQATFAAVTGPAAAVLAPLLALIGFYSVPVGWAVQANSRPAVTHIARGVVLLTVMLAIALAVAGVLFAGPISRGLCVAPAGRPAAERLAATTCAAAGFQIVQTGAMAVLFGLARFRTAAAVNWVTAGIGFTLSSALIPAFGVVGAGYGRAGAVGLTATAAAGLVFGRMLWAEHGVSLRPRPADVRHLTAHLGAATRCAAQAVAATVPVTALLLRACRDGTACEAAAVSLMVAAFGTLGLVNATIASVAQYLASRYPGGPRPGRLIVVSASGGAAVGGVLAAASPAWFGLTDPGGTAALLPFFGLALAFDGASQTAAGILRGQRARGGSRVMGAVAAGAVGLVWYVPVGCWAAAGAGMAAFHAVSAVILTLLLLRLRDVPHV